MNLHLNHDKFIDRLSEAGLTREQCGARALLLEDAQDKLQAMAPESSAEPFAFLVPGRIEFLGKHTDYAGGRSLLCTADRGFAIVASPRKDRIVQIANPTGGPPIRFEMSPALSPVPGHWSNYAIAVARRLVMNFPGDRTGADIAFSSDLPPSAGLSSSSALVVAFYLALAAINRISDCDVYRDHIKSNEDLAGYLGTIENGQSFGNLTGDKGVGTFGGSEDHTAILCARPNMLRQYSFCPVRAERAVSIPAGYALAVGVSGVTAEKTGAARDAYNAVSLSVSAIMERWRSHTRRADKTLAAAVESSPDAAAQLRQWLTDEGSKNLVNRFDQFIAESTQIIPAVTNALADSDLHEVGMLVDRSQELGARLLGNQVDETVYLAKAARAVGAAAASAFGAGFGGSVWAMVRKTDGPDFIEQWRGAYQSQFPTSAERSSFFITTAGPAAMRV